MKNLKNKKTLYISLGSLCALIVLVLIIVLSVKSCNKSDNNNDDDNTIVTTHTHTYATTWSSDATNHWYADTCGHNTKKAEATHTYGDWVVVTQATETTKGSKKRTCSVCGYVETASIEETTHTHTYDTAWTYDDSKHWHKATCGHDVISSEASHTLVDGKCSVCGYQTATKGVKYTLSSDGNSYTVSGVEDGATLSGAVVFASTIDGKPVTTIGTTAFYENSTITSVTIPNSVKTIELGAFASCAKLTSINIPDSVTTLGEMAFYDCTSLTSITIPNSVTNVGVGLFEDCTKLSSITLSENITKISPFMFYECTSLTSLMIPSKVTSIEYTAFYKCTSLTSIVIPDSVTSIGYEAFDSCSSLANVTMSNNLVSLGIDVFKDCTSLVYNEYDNARYIGSGENKYLILMSAKSTDITSCTINENCKFIADSAFSKCSSLTTVTTSNSLYSIGNYAFNQCSSLTSITIPSSITNLGNQVFYNCTSLTYTLDDNGCYLGNTENPYLVYLKTKNNTITTFAVNSQCKFICSEAFADCYFTTFTIPDNVISVGSYAFIRCKSLKTVTLSKNMPVMEECLFYMCSAFESIVIPSTVTTVKNYVFNYCTSLTSIYYEGTEKEWTEITSGYNQDAIENVDKYYYSETEPTDTTNKYWHYVDGVVTEW